jgi:hypothetical protein
MERIKELAEQVRAAFGRLTQREQFIVLGGGAAAVLTIFLLIGLLVSSAISKAENRVKLKTDQLTQVLQLQGEYKTRKREREAKLRELGRSNVKLVSLVEDLARQAGVEIGQVKSEEGEPNADGIRELRADLKVSNLSADRLQKFLELIENAPGLVITRRLKVNRPFRKDTADIELTLTTYKANQG